MPALEWQDQFNIGVPEIDEQHKRWFQMTEHFRALVEEGTASREDVVAALAAAIKYAKEHFKDEEKLMKAVGVPQGDFEMHQIMHDAFLIRVSALNKHCAQGNTTVVMEAAIFMSGWLLKHILETDVKYIAYYQKKSATKLSGSAAAPRAKRISKRS